jgi:hypothetical protein
MIHSSSVLLTIIILIAKVLLADSVAGIKIPSDAEHFGWYSPLQAGSTIDNSLISEMLRRLPTSDDADIERRLNGYALQKWPFQPDVYIGMTEVETSKEVKNSSGGFLHFDNLYSDLSVIAVRLDDQHSKFSVVAVLAEPLRVPHRYNGYNFRFDFAPFKFKESDYAFGIRATNNVCGTGYCTKMEWLDLYRIDGQAIHRILSTPITYESSCIRNCSDSEPDTTEAATISVSAESTNGVFNLIKRYKRKPPAVFKWDGSEYRLNGKDPFESFSESLTEPE